MVSVSRPRFTRTVGLLTLLCGILLSAAPQTGLAQSLKVLHGFNAYPDGDTPVGSLVAGPDGAYYGVISSGGEYGYGSVFRVTPGGEFANLYSFSGDSNGDTPSLLIAGRSGLYGLTYNTLFTITTGGALTTLYKFASTDGPAGLIQGSDGKLYGITSTGGAGGYGTVFSVNTDGSKYTTLYTFTDGLDGAEPTSLIQGIDHRLYGTALGGGTSDSGTVFRIGVTGTNFSVLHAFNFDTDGDSPQALVQGTDGTLYGSTGDGGINYDGTLFRIAPNGSAFSTLVNFNLATSGYSPQGLTFGADGALYGVASYGGKIGYGTLYRIGTDGKGFHVLHQFAGADDGGEQQSLTLAPNGSFYGVAAYGGNGRGVLFHATTNGTVKPVYLLAGSADGAYPVDVTVGSDGNAYGVTEAGGVYDAGTIFRQTPNGGISTLYSFTGGDDGYYPINAPILARNGTLYGTTPYGGVNGTGVIYSLTPAGNFTVLYAFSAGAYSIDGGITNSDGTVANGLTLAPSGFLYGTCAEGGVNGVGTVFRIRPNGSQFTVVHTFADGRDQGTPIGRMIVGLDGNLYGTTTGYGTYSNNPATYGSLFKVAPSGNLTTLYLLTSPTVAANPAGTLVQGKDGTLYGTCGYTGIAGNGYGSIFSAKPDRSGLTNLYTFSGGQDGAYPGGLLLNSDGALYGITSYSGNDAGEVFRIGTDGSGFTMSYRFKAAALGAYPAALAASGAGILYGVTVYGGETGEGTLFRFVP